MPLNFTLASRNLLHDRLRFVATTIGIVFSVVLVMVQMGLYLGFGHMVTRMIDRSDADLWVMRRGTKCFEDPSLIDARKQGAYQAIPGVASAEPLVIGFSDWHMKSGAITPVFIVGSNLNGIGLRPWDVVKGSVDSLSQEDAVAVDETYHERLGTSGIGSTAEIRGQPVKVTVLTQGIRSFTTTPYVFVDMNRARTYIGIPKTYANYFLIKLKPGADAAQVSKAIEAQSPTYEVLTQGQFAERSRTFWLFGTGAGTALFAGALLGVIVGTVIVAQTLYSSTKDHIEEFATLRAIGSSNRYIYKVIMYQALLNAVIGFVLAAIIGYAVVLFTRSGSLPVVITPWLMGAIFLLTVVMCVASAFTAILRVVRIDPVVVFSR
ncbi:MAG TPA: ABC transporter permease [Pseudolabrys sp.]|jgi:putative ABC transport system permease protein|uniref:ABC transporter permease n=1 Tax=Pseudolabrys sp. TaxID=1960880 RepID=UPI002DDD8F1A|nr:ABC transporter permease [Pseudolabrys sp.]HEV2628242.1 ABC transporter permease [Pseudolabrys sp.]